MKVKTIVVSLIVISLGLMNINIGLAKQNNNKLNNLSNKEIKNIVNELTSITNTNGEIQGKVDFKSKYKNIYFNYKSMADYKIDIKRDVIDESKTEELEYPYLENKRKMVTTKNLQYQHMHNISRVGLVILNDYKCIEGQDTISKEEENVLNIMNKFKGKIYKQSVEDSIVSFEGLPDVLNTTFDVYGDENVQKGYVEKELRKGSYKKEKDNIIVNFELNNNDKVKNYDLLNNIGYYKRIHANIVESEKSSFKPYICQAVFKAGKLIKLQITEAAMLKEGIGTNKSYRVIPMEANVSVELVIAHEKPSIKVWSTKGVQDLEVAYKKELSK